MAFRKSVTGALAAVIVVGGVATGTYVYREHEQSEVRAANCAKVHEDTDTQNALRPSASESPRLAFLGDSYSAGRGAEAVDAGYAYITGRALGVPTTTFAVGGSGVLAEGSCGDGRFSRRIDPVIDWKPDVLVVQTGLNDRTFSADEITAAASDLLATLKTELPTTDLILLGPVDPVGDDSSLTHVPAALAQAAAQEGIVFVDPIADDWINDGNRAELIGGDALHPTQAGHDYLAEQVRPVVADRLGAVTSG